MNDENCGNCYFMRHAGGKTKCYRFPPQVVVSVNGNILSRYPIMKELHWCGEWLGIVDDEGINDEV
jgi:hypothetical protein